MGKRLKDMYILDTVQNIVDGRDGRVVFHTFSLASLNLTYVYTRIATIIVCFDRGTNARRVSCLDLRAKFQCSSTNV